MDTTLADALVGRVLDGRYRVQERIARGGMATVYRGVDIRLDRPVAIKVMHSSLAEDPDFVARFTREAKAAARLSHPNVVAVFDQGSDNGVVFLVMEYVDGATLRDLIRDRGRLSPRQALDVMKPILAALDAAHRAGIVHRDIKPENVLIAGDGRIKVADFGLARAITVSRTTATTGLLIGTAAYLAPEQIERGVADPRTDLYAAGIVLYELLVGRPPYDGLTPMVIVYKHVNEQVPAPSLARTEVPGAVDALVLDATQRDPADRPPSAAELLAQLEAAARLLPPEPLDLTQPTQVLGAHLTTVLNPGAPPVHTLVSPPDWPPPPPLDPAEEAAPRHSWWRGWRLALILVVLLTLIAGASGAYLGIRAHNQNANSPGANSPGAGTPTQGLKTTAAPTTVAMPDFTGKTRAAANALAAANQLAQPTYALPQYDAHKANGTVMDQDVEPQVQVRTGTSVLLTLSKGPEPVAVPANLVGMQLAEAATALQAVHLKLGGHSSEYNADQPEGAVLRSTKPGPFLPGTAVSVVVSRGPAPVAVPDVAQQSLSSAKAELAGHGFTHTNVIREYSDTVAEGLVIRQSPKPPATAQTTSTVTLYVSKGAELFRVPDLFGLTVNEAKAALANVGMVAKVMDLRGGRNEHVLSQDPGHNAYRRHGTVVTIRIF